MRSSTARTKGRNSLNVVPWFFRAAVCGLDKYSSGFFAHPFAFASVGMLLMALVGIHRHMTVPSHHPQDHGDTRFCSKSHNGCAL